MLIIRSRWSGPIKSANNYKKYQIIIRLLGPEMDKIRLIGSIVVYV